MIAMQESSRGIHGRAGSSTGESGFVQGWNEKRMTMRGLEMMLDDGYEGMKKREQKRPRDGQG